MKILSGAYSFLHQCIFPIQVIIESTAFIETRHAHSAGPQHIATSAGWPWMEGTTDGRDVNKIKNTEKRNGPQRIEAATCSPGTGPTGIESQLVCLSAWQPVCFSVRLSIEIEAR